MNGVGCATYTILIRRQVASFNRQLADLGIIVNFSCTDKSTKLKRKHHKIYKFFIISVRQYCFGSRLFVYLSVCL